MQGKPRNAAPSKDGSSTKETNEAVIQRSVNWYNQAIATYISSIAASAVPEDRCRNILVLSHGAYIARLFRTMISTNHFSCPAELKDRLPVLGNAGISIVEYRTVTRGKHREVDAVILQYGDISHLHGLRVIEDNADEVEAT